MNLLLYFQQTSFLDDVDMIIELDDLHAQWLNNLKGLLSIKADDKS